MVAYARKLKLQDWIEVDVDGRRLTLRFNRQTCDEASRLDGCYVIKTDLPTGDAPAGMIHDRYKDLARVESACRTSNRVIWKSIPPLSRQRPVPRDMLL